MKKDNGIVSTVYNWGSKIVTVVEIVGCCTRNAYICIGVGVFLVSSIFGNFVRKLCRIREIGDQRTRNLKHLYMEYVDIKKALINKELSDIERDELQKEEIDLLGKRKEVEDKHYKKQVAIKREYNKRLLTCGIALVVLLMVNAVPLIYASAKEMVNMIQKTNEENDQEINEGQVDNTSIDISEEEGERDIQEEPNESEDAESIESIVQGMSFYLDNPTLEWIPTPEMEAAVLYVTVNHPDIQNIVKQHVDQLLKTNLEDTYNDCLSSAEERLASDASKLETDFDISRKMVKQYAAENNPTKWKEALRHSTDLDAIIDNRLELWKSNKRNGTLASLIANNYQDYALEYQNQKKSGYTILSYYMKTIIWVELELCYEDTNKEETFDYLKARYWDIVTCQDIPKQYRDLAEAIYFEMGNYEDYIK